MKEKWRKNIFMKPKGKMSIIIMYGLVVLVSIMFIMVMHNKYKGIAAEESNRYNGNNKRKVLSPNERKELEKKIKEYVDNFFKKEVENVSWIKSKLVMGSKNPKIVVIEFSDFECPFCRAFAMSLRQVYEKYKEDVQIIFKHFPLSSGCNKYVNLNMHPYACDLAYASMCAYKYKKFKKFYDIVTSIRDRINDNSIVKILKNIKMNNNKYERCMSKYGKEIEEYVLKDVEDGMKIKISATPTIFINGRKIEGFVPPVILDIIFRRILSKE
jgi:protein-disulfide isomerase